MRNVDCVLVDADVSFFSKEHAQGLVDPRYGTAFSGLEVVTLNNYEVFNALHCSMIDPRLIVDYGIPSAGRPLNLALCKSFEPYLMLVMVTLYLKMGQHLH
jgi:hypothetical protein